MAASLCFKSCEDHSLLKGYNGGQWKNSYRSVPCSLGKTEVFIDFSLTVKAATLIFISGRGSPISSAQEL